MCKDPTVDRVGGGENIKSMLKEEGGKRVVKEKKARTEKTDKEAID